MSIIVSIDGIESVREQFRRLTPRLQSDAVRKLAQATFNDVQDGADRHTKTGQLARSTYIRQLNESAWEIGHDQQQAPHAVFVLFGSRPHVIRPKNRKALRWPSGSVFRFAKLVNHPGYRGDNYFQRAADDAPRKMASIISQLQRDLP